LKKKYSIKENESIQKILTRGRFFKSTVCVVYVLKNGTDKNNIAFLAGKKLGTAPVRNKAKRKLRAAMRSYWDALLKGYDIVLIARPRLLTSDQATLMQEVALLLKKHKIVNKELLSTCDDSSRQKIGDVQNEKTV
jgi:ribonuclease P protein component